MIFQKKLAANKKHGLMQSMFFIQFVEKPPVKKAEGFCLLVVDKV